MTTLTQAVRTWCTFYAIHQDYLKTRATTDVDTWLDESNIRWRELFEYTFGEFPANTTDRRWDELFFKLKFLKAEKIALLHISKHGLSQLVRLVP